MTMGSPPTLDPVQARGDIPCLLCGTRNLETLHEKAPFGVVSGTWKFERQVNGQSQGSGTTRLTLTEINQTALTELPDRN